MDIEHYSNDTSGHFRAIIDQHRVGTITYFISDEGKMIVNHTEVDPEHGGKGIGALLVEATVNYARENSLKIEPWCPYAKALISKNTDWHDILAR